MPDRLRIAAALCGWCLAVAAAWPPLPAKAQTAAGLTRETLTFSSPDFATPRDFFTDQPSGLSTIAATLVLPAAPATRKLPAVVIMHDCGGFAGTYYGYAEAYAAAGFAALVFDSFGPRHYPDVCAGRAPAATYTAVADAFHALVTLAGDPRIDPHRIGITGYSFGGAVAVATAFEAARRRFVAGDLRFVAHVPAYPAMTLLFEDDRTFAGGPLLLQLGDLDNYTAASRTEVWVAHARRLPGAVPIETVHYRAGHNWMGSHGGGTMVRHAKNAVVANDCPLPLRNGGDTILLQLDGQVTPLPAGKDIRAVMQACIGYGADMQADPAVAERSLQDAFAFFHKAMAAAGGG